MVKSPSPTMAMWINKFNYFMLGVSSGKIPQAQHEQQFLMIIEQKQLLNYPSPWGKINY